MNTYNNTTKNNIKDLNAKQTVIIEVVTSTNEDGKKKVVKNVYLGNWKRRRDAYYLGMVEDGMKVVRKGETTKSYRLLKLHKLLAEVSVAGYNTKTNYFITEGYDNDTVVAQVKEEAPAVPEEVASNPEVQALQEELGLEVKEIEEVSEEVAA